jgi:ABC-type nickel/cobalt efflux system permease component RcnA
MSRLRARRAGAVLVLALATLIVPTVALAHPLGNFTINHYAGLRVAADTVAVDLVIDFAEIPAFQERQRIDTDRDGAIAPAEHAAERSAACPRLVPDLSLAVGGAAQSLTPVAAGLSFPPGAGGLATMRLVCQFSATLSAPISSTAQLTFADGSFVARIGWREIVVIGDGVAIGAEAAVVSLSDRLTAYPESLLATPPDMRAVTVQVTPGGARVEPFVAPDAEPLTAAVAPGTAAAPGAVPGGVGGEIASLLQTRDLTPLVLLASLLAAALLGAGHALTPGHGKTIMAAYLVGSRGSARHAVGLGLATAVSHTLGVVALGAAILLAGSALPADRVYPVLGLASAVLVVAIGAWMLWRQGPLLGALVRRLTPAGAPVLAVAGSGHPHRHVGRHGNDHDHDHDHDHGTALARAHEQPHASTGMHSHGFGGAHAHVAPAAGMVGWRTLFALGLSGGLVPSTNALLILVATVATGRPAYGLVLVAAFGLGMAAVLVGLGIALVVAGDRLGVIGSARPGLARVLQVAPLGGAAAVLVLGLYLTWQALSGTAGL